MSNKRENRKLKTRIEKGLQNTEDAREIILEKLERYNAEGVEDENQLHLLVNYKLELLDMKLRFKDMLEHLHLID